MSRLRIMATPRDGFAGRHRAGLFFPSGEWTEIDAPPELEKVLRADRRLVVELDGPGKLAERVEAARLAAEADAAAMAAIRAEVEAEVEGKARQAFAELGEKLDKAEAEVARLTAEVARLTAEQGAEPSAPKKGKA